VIHIVDDDAQVRAATSFALAAQGYKTQIYSGTDELLGQRHLRDGCVLLKYGMPGPAPREVVVALEVRGSSNPVIMTGENTRPGEVIAALRGGALDFLQRPYAEADLIAAIERALDRSRDFAFHRQRKSSARARLARLSPRKRQVLQGLLAGMSNKVIAHRLALSPRTVELHRGTMMEELGVGNLAEALRMAIDAELAPLTDTLVANGIAASQSTHSLQHSQESVATGVRADILPSLPPALDALEGTTDCVFLLDREWRFTYLNSNARQLLGTGDELIGIRLWDKYPLSGATRAWDEFHRATADGQARRFEFYEPDLRSWLDVSVRPFAAGVQVSFRNINGERWSKAQLQLSEQTLIQVLEAAGDGAWDWNISTGQIAMSSSFLSQLGYNPKTFPQDFEGLTHLVHPDDLPALSRCLKDHLDGTTSSFKCEYRLRRIDGGWLWNLDRGRVVARDPITSLPLRMVGTASDITHIKVAQQQAEEAFERLALAQANADVGMWELDLNTRELQFCERSRIMHGLAGTPSDVLTENEWLGAVHPDDREPAMSKLRKHLDDGSAYRIRYRTIGRDGAVRWVLGTGKAVSNIDGSTHRFVGLNIDITGLAELAATDDDSVSSISEELQRAS